MDAHVGEQVDGRLLQVGVRRRLHPVVLAVQGPGVLDRAGGEHQRTAGCLVERHVVRCLTGRDLVAEVLQDLWTVADRGGQLDQTGRPESVVEILIRLVTDGVLGEYRGVTTGRLAGHVGPRQNRYRPWLAGTVGGEIVVIRDVPVPVRPFSGCAPPTPGGLKRGSRQVPVHSEDGSIFPFAQVSL